MVTKYNNDLSKKPDMVNQPPHYNAGTIEVITIIEDWKLCYHLGNVIKYCLRSSHKGSEIQDLKKAEWYLKRKISNLEKEKK